MAGILLFLFRSRSCNVFFFFQLLLRLSRRRVWVAAVNPATTIILRAHSKNSRTHKRPRRLTAGRLGPRRLRYDGAGGENARVRGAFGGPVEERRAGDRGGCAHCAPARRGWAAGGGLSVRSCVDDVTVASPTTIRRLRT